MFHAGHSELLRLMNNEADEVVVFLHDDKSTYLNKDKFPVQDFEHRKKNLLDTELVDRVIAVVDSDPGADFKWFIHKHKDEGLVYYRGDDWENFPGRGELEERGVEIVFKEYTTGISSTKIRSEL